MTIKQFSTAFYDKRYAGSTVPPHAQPRKTFSDKSANKLTKAILAYFEFKGVKAWRQSSEGRWLPEKKAQNVIGQTITIQKGKYIPRGGGAVGIGDVCAVINSVFTTWEVKYGKDYQKPDQIKFQQEIEASGGKYFIVKTWDDFYNKVKHILP